MKIFFVLFFVYVLLRKEKEKRIKISNFVLWLFSNEIMAVKGLTSSHPINTFPPLSHDYMSILLAASNDKEGGGGEEEEEEGGGGGAEEEEEEMQQQQQQKYIYKRRRRTVKELKLKRRRRRRNATTTIYKKRRDVRKKKKCNTFPPTASSSILRQLFMHASHLATRLLSPSALHARTSSRHPPPSSHWRSSSRVQQQAGIKVVCKSV